MANLKGATAMYLGSTTLTKVYYGSDQIWPVAAPVGGITYIGAATSGNADIDLTTITDLQQGDLVVYTSHNDNNSAATLPSGFTAISPWAIYNRSIGLMHCYKFMGAVVDTAITRVSNHVSLLNTAHVYRGVDESNPLDVGLIRYAPSKGTIMETADITTVSGGCMLIGATSFDDKNFASQVSAPAGFTKMWATQRSGVSAGFYKKQTTAGTETGFVVPVADPQPGSDNRLGDMIALRAAGAGPTGGKPTYQSGEAIPGSSTAHTSSAMSIGADVAGRVVYAAFNIMGNDKVTDVTIGGISATLMSKHVGSGRSSYLYSAAGATGTTASVVITSSVNAEDCILHVYTAINPVIVGSGNDNDIPFGYNGAAVLGIGAARDDVAYLAGDYDTPALDNKQETINTADSGRAGLVSGTKVLTTNTYFPVAWAYTGGSFDKERRVYAVFA